MPLLDVSIACANNQTAVTLKQQRFVIDAAQRRERPLADSDLPEGAGRAAATCEVMTEESRTLNIAGACAPWVFANAGAHGYYRTAYPSELLQRDGAARRDRSDAPRSGCRCSTTSGR